MKIKYIVAAVLLALSSVAHADDSEKKLKALENGQGITYTQTAPPAAPSAAPVTTPATVGYATAPVVPAVRDGAPVDDKKRTSESEWATLVTAPPQSKMSFETAQRAARAETAARDAGKLSDLSPIAGDDGSILYPFGQSWPTVVCSPLHVCAIMLGAGDKPSQIVLGQPGMWQMTQAMAGDKPILALMPRFKDLHTNLMIAATSKDGKPRVYYVTLVSDESNFVPLVGFYYPADIETVWTQQQAAADASAAKKAAAKQRADDETVAELPSLTAAKLDFNWEFACHAGFFGDCNSITPDRVFDDGKHTYLLMPKVADTTGLPTVLADNTLGKPSIINFRVKDGYYIIDGVPSKIELIAGNGTGSNRKEVDLTHNGDNK